MRQLLFFLSFAVVLSITAGGQVSDIIAVKKKNGRTIKNFYEGSPILLQEKDGEYVEGPIDKIYRDTIFIRMFTVEKRPTVFGTYAYDTLNTYVTSEYYKDIRRISVYKARGSIRQKIGLLMMIGGSGYALVNLVNGSLFNLPITDRKNLETLGISAAAVAAGILNNKIFPPNSFSRRKDQIVYVSLNK